MRRYKIEWKMESIYGAGVGWQFSIVDNVENRVVHSFSEKSYHRGYMDARECLLEIEDQQMELAYK